MPRIPSVAFAAALVASLACGTTPVAPPPAPPPPPPPPPDNTRNLVIVAGNNQQGTVGQPVAVAPSVRVVNSTGGGVAGVAVTFAVASGGGTVAGPNPTSDATGLATAGSWTLGPAPGPNSLTVTAAAGTGGPATITATAIELVLAPTRDTTIAGGNLNPKRVEIPAGITVTVTGDLTLQADSLIDIRGTLRGSCVAMTLDTRQDLFVPGVVDNSCPAPMEAPPAMLLVGRTGYEVNGGTITTSGDFEITNDPTFTEDQVPGPPAAAANRAVTSGRSDAGALVIGGCKLTAGRLTAGTKAREGTGTGKVGGPGGNGRRLWVSCRGNATVGAMTIEAQDGGDGGKGTDNTVNAVAAGGAGGRGGEIRFLGSGSITFDDRADIRTGDGGKGGDADALPTGPGAGLKASNAKATGGRGGEPGLFRVKAAGQIIFPPFTGQTFTIGKAGDGGNALAVAADGAPAGAVAAQAGGDADAEGGKGASTPDKQLQGAGVGGGGRPDLAGGDGGRGGDADAKGGKGGDGGPGFRDGANGGDIRAKGGDGGDALLRDFNGAQVGDAGDGGNAILRGGLGGNGAGSCTAPLTRGGDGGRGGDGSGGPGAGGSVGTGAGPAPVWGGAGSGAAILGNPGQPGTVNVRDNAGNGGDAANGIQPGTRGGRGSDTVSPLNRTDTAPVFTLGKTAQGCPFTTEFAVDSDPQGHEGVLGLTANPRQVRVTKQGTSVLIQFLDFQAGTASGSRTSSGAYRAFGSFQILTPLGVRQGSMDITLVCDEETGTFTGTIILSGLPGGPVTYDVAGRVP